MGAESARAHKDAIKGAGDTLTEAVENTSVDSPHKLNWIQFHY